MPNCTGRRKDTGPVNNSNTGVKTHETKSTTTTKLSVDESLMGARRDEGANRNMPEEIPTESRGEEAPRESHNNTHNIIDLDVEHYEDIWKEDPLPSVPSG